MLVMIIMNLESSIVYGSLLKGNITNCYTLGGRGLHI
jgi:hypothetical protein